MKKQEPALRHSGLSHHHISCWSVGSSSTPLLVIQLLINVLGGWQTMDQVLGVLPPTRGVWMELWSPDFTLAQPWLLCAQESELVALFCQVTLPFKQMRINFENTKRKYLTSFYVFKPFLLSCGIRFGFLAIFLLPFLNGYLETPLSISIAQDLFRSFYKRLSSLVLNNTDSKENWEILITLVVTVECCVGPAMNSISL